MNLASVLRQELAERAVKYAQSEALRHALSYGETPAVCFVSDDGSRHGNFIPGSYKAIMFNPAWRRRLTKVHTQARRSLPPGRKRAVDGT